MLSVNPTGTLEDVTPERVHIYSATTTRTWSTKIYTDSIVHSPVGRFVNTVGISPTFAFRVEEHGIWTWFVCAERESALKIKTYWNFRKKDGARVPEVLSKSGIQCRVTPIWLVYLCSFRLSCDSGWGGSHASIGVVVSDIFR